MEHNEGTFLYHTHCPSCGSSDANAVYDNGTTYCFSCTKAGRSDGKESPMSSYKKVSKVLSIPTDIEYRDLGKRKITKDICRKYSYGYVTYNGEVVQGAGYYNSDNELIAMKLRYPNKDFKFLGKPKEASLFGKQLWGSGGKYITITEGEVDALSVAEAFDGKYPVVSIPNGASAAKKAIAKELEWLNSFEKIILWFDNDAVGRTALEDVVPMFPAGKVKIIQHPEFKDANDVLVNKGKSGVVEAFYNAKDYRPDGIVTVDELEELVLKPVEYGLPWCFDGLTKLTYGRRYGELHLLGAGVSIKYSRLV